MWINRKHSEASVCYLQEHLPAFFFKVGPPTFTYRSPGSPFPPPSPSSPFPSRRHIIRISVCSQLFLFPSLFLLLPQSFLTLPLVPRPPLLHLFSVSHNAKWWRHSKCVRARMEPGVGKRRQTKTTERRALLFKQTSGWHWGLRIAVVSQTWFSLTAWCVEILVQGESVDTDRNTQSLTVWQIDRETKCQPDRQFAKEGCLSIPLSLSLSVCLSQFLLLFIRTEAPSLCFLSKQRLWISGLKKGKKGEEAETEWAEELKQTKTCDNLPGRGDVERKW